MDLWQRIGRGCHPRPGARGASWTHTVVMRAKVFIPLILAGLVAVLLPFVSRSKHSAPDGPKAPAAVAGNAPASGAGRAGPGEPGPSSAAPVDDQPDSRITLDAGAASSPASSYEDYVNQRTAELEDLGMTGDTNALITIESELEDRDPRIQAAAVSAAIQFGSRAAIPALQEAYGHTDDPAQKLRLQQAVEFLELPTESEITNANPPAGEDRAAH